MVDEIRKGYTFEQPSIDLGVLSDGGEPVPDARIRIPLAMLSRHGLVAGATGTGKTITLQLLAESCSAAGIPVFAADIKGDLSGLAEAGEGSPKLAERTARNGQDWRPAAAPTQFFALGGQGSGTPLRSTISAFGPLLLAKVLGLNETQESTLGLLFSYADRAGLPLVDLVDLSELLKYLTGDAGKAELKDIGGVSTATAGVILRAIVNLSAQGGDVFFGEPEFDTADLLRTDASGAGIVSVLELPNLQDRPALFSTFLMWLLADLYHDLPEVGDQDRPRLVFFFDEAHLLFDGASKAFLEQITRTVRLVRSKGVGVFFITQQPTDVPEDVLAQLGSRIQHQLRAHTPKESKALRATVDTYPRSGYELAEVIQGLGIGQAVVTVMDPDGAPTPVAWTRIFAPRSRMGAVAPDRLAAMVAASPLEAKYAHQLNRESAQEILAARLAAGARAEQEARNAASGTGVPQPVAQPRPERAGEQPRPVRANPKEKNIVEEVVGSPAFRQFARSAGREIVRSLFGTGRRR